MFIEQWAGREWDLRRRAHSVFAALQATRVAGDQESVSLFVGQNAGLIDSVLPAEEVIRGMVEEAEQITTDRLPAISRARQWAAPNQSLSESMIASSRWICGIT